MNGFPIIAITIGLILILLLAVMFIVYRRTGERPETDYRVFFILGITWLPLGIAMDNPGFWGMGAVFLAMGLANRDKWQSSADGSNSALFTGRTQLFLVVGLALLLALSMTYFFLNRR